MEDVEMKEFRKNISAVDDVKESRFSATPPPVAANQLKDRQVRRMFCRANTNFHPLQIERTTSRGNDGTPCRESTQGTSAAIVFAGLP